MRNSDIAEVMERREQDKQRLREEVSRERIQQYAQLLSVGQLNAADLRFLQERRQAFADLAEAELSALEPDVEFMKACKKIADGIPLELLFEGDLAYTCINDDLGVAFTGYSVRREASVYSAGNRWSVVVRAALPRETELRDLYLGSFESRIAAVHEAWSWMTTGTASGGLFKATDIN